MRTTTMSFSPVPGDRYAQISVIALTLLALLLGWGVKTAAQNRTADFSAEAVSAHLPGGWRNAAAGGQLLSASNPLDPTTTYAIETVPATGDLADVATLLTLRRGQDRLAYRILNQTPVTLQDRSGFRVDFVYVDADPTMTMDHLPAVLRGVDYLFSAGDRVVVVTLTAEENEFERALPRFWRFLDSVSF